MKTSIRFSNRHTPILAMITLVGLTLGAEAQTYLVTDLGTLVAGGTSSAAAINNSNQVAGTSTTPAGGFDAVLLSGGVLHDLGNPGGDSSASAMNSLGDVAGSSTTTVYTTTNHPFLVHNGVFMDLGIPANINTGFAYGVNIADQVVGELVTGTRKLPTNYAFIWQSGTFEDLGSLGGSSSAALAINDSGEVVGWSYTAAGDQHATLWKDGVITDLGFLPEGEMSSASAINDAGEIVGSSDTTNFGPSHAVIFQNGSVIDLGVPSGFTISAANAVNIHGVVVGDASVESYRPTSHAFVAQNGTITDLNNLIPGNAGSWILQTATGINDGGVIVGTGTTNGVQHGFLLTPTTMVTVPDAPLNLAATSGNSVVSLTWQGSFGATSYTVKRATSTAGPFVNIATVNTTNYIDTTVVDCTTYDYVVSAANSAGASPNSSSVAGDPQSVPPAPSNLTAKPNTEQDLELGSAILLAWKNNAGTCSEYVIIQRSTNDVNFQTLATAGYNQTTYTDGFLNSGTRYYYRVLAESNGGESGPSNVANAVAPKSSN